VAVKYSAQIVFVQHVDICLKAGDTMDDAEMHRRIVGYGVRVLGVSFRTEAPDSPVLRSLDNDGFFARKLRDTARPVLHVHVRRSQGGIWAPDEHGNIDAFLSGVGARVHETCMIAHELGHAVLEIERRRTGTADEFGDHLEGIGKRLGEEKPITVAEANAFYGEEKAAWEHGARLLDERGFTRWFRFGQVCEKSLATYERAIQSCCVGWRAPPLNDFLDPLVARDPPSVA